MAFRASVRVAADTAPRRAGKTPLSVRAGRISPSEPIAASNPRRTAPLRVKGARSASRSDGAAALDALIPAQPRPPPRATGRRR